MVVLHHNDLDGRCAAAIVYRWAGITHPKGKSDFIEMDYAKAVPFDKIEKDEQVFILDFSLSVEDMRKLLKITDNVVWIDHHKTAIDRFNSSEIKGVRNTADSGCVLTWKYIHWWSGRGSDWEDLTKPCPRGLEVPRAVAMIGDYDTWTLKIPNSTEFYEGCKMLDTTDIGSDDWRALLMEEAEGVDGTGKPLPRKDVCTRVIEMGKTAIKYRDAYCEDMCSSYGFETDFDGHNIFVCNIYRFGSNGFLARMDKYPICAACIYDGSQWSISLYSKRPDINVGELCKKHGGGGHKGAAGFVSKEFPFVRSK